MHSRPHDVAMYVGLYVRLVLRVCGKIAQGGGVNFFGCRSSFKIMLGSGRQYFGRGVRKTSVR